MQVKLLRGCCREKKVRKVGATQEEPVDVRIVSATHQNLAALVEAGRFRQDLYYRLNVIDLMMPSLRDRVEDIPVLARALLDKLGGSQIKLDRDAEKALCAYAFPGNVRELENTLERAQALCEEQRIHRSRSQSCPCPAPGPTRPPAASTLCSDYLDQVERAAILEALEQARFNQTGRRPRARRHFPQPALPAGAAGDRIAQRPGTAIGPGYSGAQFTIARLPRYSHLSHCRPPFKQGNAPSTGFPPHSPEKKSLSGFNNGGFREIHDPIPPGSDSH